MVLKIFKAVWFFSLLGLLAVFLYVYAGLGETVILSDGGELTISKNGLFYATLLLTAFINSLVFLAARIVARQSFKSWFYGLVVTINFFLLTTLGFLSVINAPDRFDYYRMGPTLYGSVILIAAWLISWPVYLLFQKKPAE